MSKTSSQTPSSNRLLAGLASRDRDLLRPHLASVDMTLGQRLALSDKKITHAYFPLSGMISLIHTYRDGSTIEVGLIGHEGYWGAPAVLGVKSSPMEAMVQGAGEALRIPVEALVDAANASPGLRAQLLRYAHFFQVQTAVTAACNGAHNIDQRLARWLLEAHDRLGGDEVPLSHEFLSYMLGTRRAGVTAALGTLKDKGFITIGRARIGIQKRKQIERESCECYRIVKDEYRRVFAQPKTPNR